MRSAGVLAAAAVVLAACSAGQPQDRTRTGDAATADGGLSGTLTVLAAASLTDAFEDLGEELATEHPGLDVRFAFAGSATLAAQVLQGAPADVFAAADEAQMARVVEAGLAAGATVFAENSLVVAVPRADPAGVRPSGSRAGPPSLRDLLDEEMVVAVCAPEVPCGAAAARVLDVTDLTGAPDTYEDDVRAVLTKVGLAEVDAGLVYRSDVVSAGDDVAGVAFREAALAVNRYPLAVLGGSGNPAAARAFVELVLSDTGRQALAAAGFLAP